MKIDLLAQSLIVSLAVSVGVAEPFADGGFRDAAPRECDTDWSYVGAPNGGVEPEEVPAVDGCLSIVDFPPFDADSETLFEPDDERTDKNFWCSFKQNKLEGNAVYKVEAGGNAEDALAKQTAWGFCLRTIATNSSEPTVTSAPSTEPATSDIVATADGANLDSPVPCDTDWSYVDGDSETQAGSGCLDGDLFPPFGWDVKETLNTPTNSSTDTTRWCSIKQSIIPEGNTKYDVNPDVDPDDIKKTAWGFCLDALALEADTSPPSVSETSSPTPPPSVSPTVTGATQSPTMNGTTATDSPTMGEEETSQPTIDSATESPTVSSNLGSGSNTTDPAGLTSGEVAAAVVVPLVVIFAAAGGFFYYKYKTIESSSDGAGAAKAEEGAEKGDTGTGTGKPVTDEDNIRLSQI